MNFSAVILAGGKSSRMGRDKAWIEIDGQSLIARQINLVSEAGAGEIFISARTDQDFSRVRHPILTDRFSDAGPLAGIEAALRNCRESMLLVMAVDMPAMTTSIIKQLWAQCAEGRGVVPRLAVRVEPLAAFYPKVAWVLAEELLGKRQTPASHFAEMCVQNGLAFFHDIPAAEANAFANWNMPADVQRVR